MNERYCNKSVIQAGQVLKVISEAKEPVGMSEIVRYTTLKQDTVFRMLVTLEGMGWINRVGGNRFDLGMGLALIWARKRVRLEAEREKIDSALEALDVAEEN